MTITIQMEVLDLSSGILPETFSEFLQQNYPWETFGSEFSHLEERDAIVEAIRSGMLHYYDSQVATGLQLNYCVTYAGARDWSTLSTDRYAVITGGGVVNWWGPLFKPILGLIDSSATGRDRFENPFSISDAGVFIRDNLTGETLYVHAHPLRNSPPRIIVERYDASSYFWPQPEIGQTINKEFLDYLNGDTSFAPYLSPF